MNHTSNIVGAWSQQRAITVLANALARAEMSGISCPVAELALGRLQQAARPPEEPKP